LRITDLESKRVFYLDPKLYTAGTRDSSFRTFYFEPKKSTNKCAMTRCISWLDLSTRHAKVEQGSPNGAWKFIRWDLVDLRG